MADAPPSVLRVVNASRVLDSSTKLLLGEIFRLDRSHKGCYARQAILARRVGRSVQAMKACRTKLREAGFLERSEERLSGDRRQYIWFFSLPEEYWPSEYAKDEEIFALADQLDADLRSGKIREQAEDSRKVLDAIKRAAGVGSVVSDLDRVIAKAKEREQVGIVDDTHSNRKQVSSTIPIEGETGIAHDPISPKQVSPTTTIGIAHDHDRYCGRPPIGIVDDPPYKRTEENCKERISTEQNLRTESSRSDLPQKKNGTTESDPNTKPQGQSPECPHPHGSPEWKHWHLAHLRASVGAP